MAPERDTDGRLLGAHLDITEAKAAAEHIRRAASHDGLTGLPNRSHFHERFENALKAAAATGETLGLLALDVDDFRSEEHTSELQSLMRISYAVFCLKKKTN